MELDLVRELVEHAPVVGFIKDEHGRYLYINAAWQGLFGLSSDDVLGKNDREIFPEDIASAFMGNDRRVLVNGSPLIVHERVLVRGEERTYLSSKFPLHEPGRVLLGGFAVDVSSSEASRAELVRSEARFRRLVEHSPETIIVFDVMMGRFVEVNENGCRMFGLSREDILQSSPAELSPPFQADGRTSLAAAGDYIQSALDGASPVFDWLHLDAEGGLIPCRIWLQRMDETGVPWVRASILDMREIDRTRQALLEAQVKLEHARRLEGLGRLAGGIAHDFNNLLTIMVGSITFLGDLPDPSAELTEELTALRDAALQARGLTQQLLAFAREPAGVARVVAVDRALGLTMGTLRRLVGEDVSFESRLLAGGAQVLIDPAQLDQIVLNLVVNAREAVGPGGSIRVETSQELGVEGARVVLSVRDDGRGMSPEVKEKAFEPFFSTKGRGRGTGLGLSTVYGIVQAAGGEARIDAHRGRGTTISVHLPCFAGDEEPSGPPRLEHPAGQGCVLVVEDEDAVRRVTTRLLTRAGYRVLEAALPSAALALAQAEVEAIHLIVSDVVMPEMNGFVLADRLTALLPGVPVLFVSGYPTDEVSEQGHRGRPFEFLPKPFTGEELLMRVRAVLAGAGH